jgi:N-acetylneuraminic acid mutarotase
MKSIDPDILALSRGGQWELVGKLPMALSSPADAIIGGKLYVGGGSRTGRGAQAEMVVTGAP